jgi:hypothetical protein
MDKKLYYDLDKVKLAITISDIFVSKYIINKEEINHQWCPFCDTNLPLHDEDCLLIKYKYLYC